jgi:hypothetical protein
MRNPHNNLLVPSPYIRVTQISALFFSSFIENLKLNLSPNHLSYVFYKVLFQRILQKLQNKLNLIDCMWNLENSRFLEESSLL